MAPKQKAQKMSIGTFLADENLGSWADEMEDMPLPAAPPSQTSYGGDRRIPGATATGFNGYPDRGGLATREPLPLPTQPPYTAHIGNLSFDATQNDISDLFASCGVTNVRIVEDKLTRTPKGFGYVEFATVDGLKKALDLSGATLQGRSIRISVADPPKDRADAKEFDWTRKGPLPDLAQRRVPERSTFGRNFDNVSEAGSDRGGRRNFESDGKVRDFGNWERKGPLSPVGGPVREGGRSRNNEGPGFRRNSPAWGEGRSQDGSRPPRREFHERAPTAAELDTEWRARMRPAQPAAKEQPSAPTSPVAAPAAPAAPTPATRPKLNLQKRTVTESPAAPIAGESKASPFGGARPIDTAAREREIEEKRQLAIRQKKEVEEKAKAEKAEKQRLAKEQARAEKATTADPNGRDVSETPQGGKNFDILRQAGDDENEESADNEAEAAPEKAQESKQAADVPASKANGSWRKAPVQVAEAADEEGWSTVGSKQRNNRRGRAVA